MEVISSIFFVLAILVFPLIVFTFLWEDMETILISIVLAILVTAFLINREETKNAEFEAKNCPKMLQVDSEYCKPVEVK